MENQNIDLQIPTNLVAKVTDAEQATFYKKTYLHVALAVLAFFIIEVLLLKSDFMVNLMLSMLDGFKWLIVLGAFWLGSSMADRLAHAEKKSTQYLGLLFYVVLEALIFLPLIAIAFYYSGSAAVVNQAAFVTLALFAGLSAVVFLTNTNFSFLRTALIVGSFIAAGLIIAGTLFGFDLGLWFSVAMVVFAAAAILYQTSKLKYEYTTDQYVGAALGLFASLMLLFWYVLQIFLSRD